MFPIFFVLNGGKHSVIFMYSFLYTALQNLLPAHYFIPPVAKIGNLKYVSYFFVLNGAKKSVTGNLLPFTLARWYAGDWFLGCTPRCLI